MALQRNTIQVQGTDRTYWLAPAADPDAPILLGLHGSGMSGPLLADWTGLATRGPAAGFTTVFPDARQERWDDTGLGRTDGLDDAAFVAALVDLMQKGHSPRRRVVLVGLSNGATFAEHLTRTGAAAVDCLVLVAGTARVVSRRAVPVPRQPASVLIVVGTADPQMPYRGGRSRGLIAWVARRRARSVLRHAEGREVVAVETLAADWAAVNGCPIEPGVEHLDGPQPADRITWSKPGHRPVVLYRLVGAGHGWPGSRQYAPAWLVGRIPQGFDATAVALEFAAQSAGGLVVE